MSNRARYGPRACRTMRVAPLFTTRRNACVEQKLDRWRAPREAHSSTPLFANSSANRFDRRCARILARVLDGCLYALLPSMFHGGQTLYVVVSLPTGSSGADGGRLNPGTSARCQPEERFVRRQPRYLMNPTARRDQYLTPPPACQRHPKSSAARPQLFQQTGRSAGFSLAERSIGVVFVSICPPGRPRGFRGCAGSCPFRQAWAYAAPYSNSHSLAGLAPRILVSCLPRPWHPTCHAAHMAPLGGRLVTNAPFRKHGKQKGCAALVPGPFCFSSIYTTRFRRENNDKQTTSSP